MRGGSSDLVREVAFQRYVRPAISSGKRQFSIAVKDLMRELRPKGFPSSNYSQICSSIKEKAFIKGNGIRVIRLEGPPSGQSSTVVVHYEVIGTGANSSKEEVVDPKQQSALETAETPAARAQRLMEGLRGLLKEEYEEYGGGEAFLRWIRSEDDAPPTPGPAR